MFAGPSIGVCGCMVWSVQCEEREFRIGTTIYGRVVVVVVAESAGTTTSSIFFSYLHFLVVPRTKARLERKP